MIPVKHKYRIVPPAAAFKILYHAAECGVDIMDRLQVIPEHRALEFADIQLAFILRKGVRVMAAKRDQERIERGDGLAAHFFDGLTEKGLVG
ncbi:hypothetical protein D1872_302030 [compost metagenome]